MRFSTLADWLSWQETLHPTQVELGLGRLCAVAGRLGISRPAPIVITVGGTNGKGSCAAMLAAILSAAGYRVGTYTSPHLLRYNERVRIGGTEAQDSALCGAFERIDAARGNTTLTYFEFGTLAALELFQEAQLDVAILEVGLGGRLDAVNLVDADAALIASVGIDHVEWLGPDRDGIAREKAGIMRGGRPAVYGEPDPPPSLLSHAEKIGARLSCLGRDYNFCRRGSTWCWWSSDRRIELLPLPSLIGEYQIQNAAAVVAVLQALAERLPVSVQAMAVGLRDLRLPGRFQVMAGSPERILDVAHNPHGAAALASTLAQRPCAGRTLAVIAMLSDKDVMGVAGALKPLVQAWYPAGLAGARGLSGGELARRLHAAGLDHVKEAFTDVAAASAQARRDADPADRLVIFGSFHTVADALRQEL